MTKHLRLIMLSLLAMICMGGYSAVGDTYKLVKAIEELKAGDVIAIANNYDDNHVAMAGYNSNKYVIISMLLLKITPLYLILLKSQK